ncbi:hypothetical protein JL721_2885 [Aureococcus anophagefferens]|nr:hypothetical protein JL721_2885 [Aureococcus anophagefferens]
MASSERRRAYAAPLLAAVGLAGAAFLGAAYVSGARPAGNLLSLAADATSLRSATDVAPPQPRLIVQSEYEQRLGIPIGDGLYGHVNLVELHVKTRLTLAFPDARTEVNVGSIRWEIGGTDGAEGDLPSGRQVEARFVQLGLHRVAVKSESDVDYHFHVTARYVRREIRDLTDADRTRYLDALAIVYRTPQADGEKLYGSNFKSAAWLVREHLYGAADRSCDHWHDDAGFLNHHVAVTMQLEESLQAVDSKVASHYWDYTVDAVLGKNYSRSVFFDEAWFGDSSPAPEQDHVVNTGRWAYTPYTMGVEDALYQMPACADFQSTLTTSDLSFSAVSSELNGGLHGMVHIMLGGHWWANRTSFAARLADHVDDMRSSPHIADQFLLGSKFLWRQGFVHCPDTCDEGEDEQSCACNCPDAAIKGRSALDIFHLTGLLAIVPQIESILVKQIGFSYDEVLAEMCHVGHPGEMFTSAAPQDPIFWPLHGLSERFVQLIRLLSAKGVMTFDDTWEYTHITSVLSDTRVVCDWSAVEAEEAATGATNVFAKPECYQNTTCPGHKADDVLPFTGLSWATDVTFTNAQFYTAISPSNTNLPYGTIDTLLDSELH